MKRLYTAEYNAQTQTKAFEGNVRRIQISDSILEDAQQAKTRVKEDREMRGWCTEISIPIANSSIATYKRGLVRNNPGDESPSEHYVYVSDLMGEGKISAIISDGSYMGVMPIDDFSGDITDGVMVHFGDNFLSHALEGKIKLDRLIIEEDEMSFNAALERYRISKEQEHANRSKERL